MLGAYDYRAKNIEINILSNDLDRNTVINQLYADNANINSKTTKLKVVDAYINNQAEFKNNTLKAIVDNVSDELHPCDMQLYTALTGSFNLELDNTSVMKTSAFVKNYNSDKTVNSYSDENSFVRLTQKDNSVLQDAVENILNTQVSSLNVNEVNPTLEVPSIGNNFINTNYDVMSISKKDCIIKTSENFKQGDFTGVLLTINDENIPVKAKVVDVNNGIVKLEFIDMPDDVANKMLYNYMKKASAK